MSCKLGKVTVETRALLSVLREMHVSLRCDQNGGVHIQTRYDIASVLQVTYIELAIGNVN